MSDNDNTHLYLLQDAHEESKAITKAGDMKGIDFIWLEMLWWMLWMDFQDMMKRKYTWY